MALSFDEALTRCYDAVAEPQLWPSAMDGLCTLLGARAVSFHPKGVGADRLRVPASSAYRDLLAEMLSGGWESEDIRAERGWPLVAQGRTIVLENEMTTEEERRRLPIYADLFARHDLAQFASLIVSADGQTWAVNAVRSESEGGFRSDEVARMRAFHPHLTRFFRFAARMSNIAGRGAVAAFAMADTPAILMDWRGRVVEVNDAVRPLLGASLDVQSGKLVARHAPSRDRLEALVTRARGANGKGGAVEIDRYGDRPLIVEIMPMRTKLVDAFNLPAILALVTEPEKRSGPNHDVLRTIFQLTGREVEIADRLGRGETAAEISDGLGMRLSSVRQVIKSVLLKTDTNRQADLVALMSRIPARRS